MLNYLRKEIASSWKGHEDFAVWLVNEMKPKVIVDLGVDYGFSTFAFASPKIGKVYGIDLFQNPERNAHNEVLSSLKILKKRFGISNVEIMKGWFSEIAKDWKLPIDILHIDGSHDYEHVKQDYEEWKGFVKKDGVILFHDVNAPEYKGFGVRRFFDEIDLPKFMFKHSYGLGVVSQNKVLMKKMKKKAAEDKHHTFNECVVTSIVGNRDKLIEQQNTDGTTFIAFTDQESKIWQVRKPCDLFQNPVMNAKVPKVLIHKFVDTDYSLWVDGNIQVKVRLAKLIKEWLGDYDIAVFNHPGRDCIYEEIDECLRRGKGDPVKLRAQGNKYLAEGYPRHNGLAECTIILRRHNERTARFNEAWWAEICAQSCRDQVSFPYIVSKTDIKVNFMRGKGYVENHPYFTYLLH